MSIENGRTYQSSRMFYKNKDHKDIYYEGHFHHNIILMDEPTDAEKVAWHKGFDDDYIIFQAGLLYPKYKIFWSNVETRGAYRRFEQLYQAFHCGDYGFAITGSGNNQIVKRVSKDGRVIYDNLGRLSPTYYDSDFKFLSNNLSCQYGFLYHGYKSSVYFQCIDVDGNLSDNLQISDFEPLVSGRILYSFYCVHNDYIYRICEITSNTYDKVTLEKLSPQDGSIISSYIYDIPTDPSTSYVSFLYHIDDVFIANNSIYIALKGYTASNNPTKMTTRLLILGETLNAVYSNTYISSSLSDYIQSTRIYYFKGSYYLYLYFGIRHLLKIYKGSSLNSVSLVQTYDYDVQDDRVVNIPILGSNNTESFGRLMDGYGNYDTNCAYFNYYRNRRHTVLENENYIIFFSSWGSYGQITYYYYFFDNAELILTDNCFVIMISNYNSSVHPDTPSTQEQIWDKYYNRQGGN